MLWICDQPLSFLAFIGLTSLMGIVINNSILLVDEGNQLHRIDPHRSTADVAIAAGTNRFMPIVLTSITSIFGLLPLALGNSMFKALAIVVIGGLTTSTFLTLLCVPVLYAYVTRETDTSTSGSFTSDWSENATPGD
jgi:multidrug efflux pump subunit AcrB